MNVDKAKIELEMIAWKAKNILNRYDPERDIIPGAPSVTHTDEVTLSLILELTEILKDLVAKSEVANDRERT